MAIVIHWKDGTTLTNGQWTGAQEVGTDGHFMATTETTNQGPAPLTLIPACNVLYIDLNG